MEPQSRLRNVRRIIDVWMESAGVSSDSVPQIATELLTNAFAVTPPGARVELELRRTGDTVEVSVTDQGPGIDLDEVPTPTISEPRGRGLMIVRGLADQLLVRRVGDRTRVTAALSLAPANGAAAGPAVDDDGR
jgi:anti-sigma regulatory factor (Ser/Thr protein kinase)